MRTFLAHLRKFILELKRSEDKNIINKNIIVDAVGFLIRVVLVAIVVVVDVVSVLANIVDVVEIFTQASHIA